MTKGAHPIRASRAQDATALKHQIDRGYVLLQFADTLGGTELGIKLRSEACDLSQARFEQAFGTVKLVGSVTLDGCPVEMMGEIEISALMQSLSEDAALRRRFSEVAHMVRGPRYLLSARVVVRSVLRRTTKSVSDAARPAVPAMPPG